MKYKAIEIKKYITLEFEEQDLLEIASGINALGDDKVSTLRELELIIDEALGDLK